ncbi:MAG: twin-arginine translocation signal domain-containing protein, partial [Acidobacteriaceae bacterium]
MTQRRAGGTRRDFLKLAGAAAASTVVPEARASRAEKFCLMVDVADAVAGSGPVRRAARKLSQALAAKAVEAELVTSLGEAAGASFVVAAARPHSEMAQQFRRTSAGQRAQELAGAESFRMTRAMRMNFGTMMAGETPAVLVEANDPLGFVYALLELAERVEYGAHPLAALNPTQPVEEHPANETRSVGRYFCCELEDKPWYYDRGFWGGYLDTLVASRFNRFCFAFGLEYDFPRGVTDDYFHLPYPYLVEVPGYEAVRVVQLRTADGQPLATPAAVSGEERRRNLETLQFVAAQTAARGLHFQLGIWT